MAARWIAFSIGLWLIAGAAWARQTGADDERDLGREVLGIFESSCAECHDPGSDDPKAQRYWDGARDLGSLASLELIDLEDPEFSIVYEEVCEDRMPPTGDGYDPLGVEQKATLLLWIQTGAPAARPVAAPEDENGTGTPPPTENDAPPAEREELTIVGKLHPLTVHFPIAFVLGAAALEALAVLGVRRARDAAGFLIAFAALSAPLAAFCGWQAGDASSTRHTDVLQLHRWVGVATMAVSILLWLSSRSRGKDGSGTLAKLYYPQLAIAVALVSYGSHQGGILSRGPDYLPLPW
ncbi:MAG: hypothetical protein GY711_06320 [bacterium]|nr:hypothetical protein [bacterium]